MLLELLGAALANDAGSASTSTADLRVHLEVVDGLLDALSPLVLLGLRPLRRKGGVGVGVEPEADEHALEGSRREETDEDGDGDGDGAENDTDGPVATTKANDLEGGSTKVDDEGLSADHCEGRRRLADR